MHGESPGNEAHMRTIIWRPIATIKSQAAFSGWVAALGTLCGNAAID
jgi:hypothetical protein